MRNIKCSQLQDDFRHIRDDERYNQTFSAFFNKLNDNYRLLCQTGIIKPASNSKYRRFNSMGAHSGQGERNAGRGRGREGRHGGSGYGREGRGRGRGRNMRGRGRGGRGRGGRNYDLDLSNVDLSCLPRDGSVNLDGDLSFTDEEWHAFTRPQQEAIRALRSLKPRNRRINQVSTGGSTISSQISEVSLPPAPAGPPTTAPSDQSSRSIASSHASQAFGRRC